MDGAIQAPVAGTRLRRFLLVAALGAAGWLLSVLFATSAAAAPVDPVADPPATETPVAESPATETPVAEAPAEQPVAEEPVGEAPTEEAPVEEPTAVEPEPESSGSASTEAAPEVAAPETMANEVMVASEPEPEPTVIPEPRPTTQPSSGGGLLGGLLGVVTNLVGGVLDTTGSLLAPVIDPPSEPIVDIPELLPAHDGWTWGGGSSSGSAETVRAEPVAPVASAPAVVTAEPAQPVEPAITRDTRFIAAPPAAQQPSLPQPEPSDADQAQHGSGGDRLPGKVPAAPAAPAGPTASAGHDHSGGARGLHGVLVAHTTLEPGDAGFTTRSRAVNAAGRAAGLPAATPD